MTGPTRHEQDDDGFRLRGKLRLAGGERVDVLRRARLFFRKYGGEGERTKATEGIGKEFAAVACGLGMSTAHSQVNSRRGNRSAETGRGLVPRLGCSLESREL